ncbi:MAG: cytochrome c [Caldilineaceae bacterium]|nr:cytochrome c [Caldilineaceae bacterium]
MFKTFSRRLLVALVLFVATIGLVGCGDKEEVAAESAPTAAAATPTETVETVAVDADTPTAQADTSSVDNEATPTAAAASDSGQDTQPDAADAPVGDVAAGENVYKTTCFACHGPDAKGIPGLGKSLHTTDSEFVRSKTDAELVAYINTGRSVDDPLNTTGVAMPPKGGNPSLTEQDMYDAVAYLRTLK